MAQIAGSPYRYGDLQQQTLDAVAERVAEFRAGGRLTPEVLRTLGKYFRVKNIFHSNAIEGNTLTVGETRLVVEQGLTLTGKPLKDQAEAKNLAEAIGFLEQLASQPAAPITERDVRDLHRLVLQGIDDENAGGYRKVTVEISGSAVKPPGPESVPAEMASLGRWLEQASVPGEGFASVKGILAAAVAHTWLVSIHPFIDGNGRVARLLMNVILMRYGVPIAIITRDDRLRYIASLEESRSSDLSAFIALLCECIHESLEEYEQAVREHRERQEWARAIADRLGEAEEIKAKNQHEVWRSAMDLLRGFMRQTAGMIDAQTPTGRIYFTDFGHLGFEKYLSLRLGESSKRTWFFRIDFKSGDRAARYLFFFGYASPSLLDRCDVTLFISREEPSGSSFYQRLDQISSPDVPGLREIGYDPKAEQFVGRYRDETRRGKIEELGRDFFEEVVRLQFSA